MSTSLSRNAPSSHEMTRAALLSANAAEEEVAFIYEKEIPLFVENELERLYEITSATLLQFRLSCGNLQRSAPTSFAKAERLRRCCYLVSMIAR